MTRDIDLIADSVASVLVTTYVTDDGQKPASNFLLPVGTEGSHETFDGEFRQLDLRFAHQHSPN